MPTYYAYYSAGGFAREVHSAFRSYISDISVTGPTPEILFIDDDPSVQGTTLHDCRVISYDEAKSIPDIRVNVAFSGPALRRKKHEICEADGLRFFSSWCHSAKVGPNVKIGGAAIFADFSMVTADATIGKAFHCNIYSYVAHDCIVGDFVTFGPRVSLNGRIKVEDDVYVGSDATFLPGRPDKFLTIGKGAVIGAGAVVTKDVEPGAVVMGNPARPR